MIISPNDFLINSTLGGLGSVDRIEASYSIGSQSIALGVLYTHPVQYFDIGLTDVLTRIQVQISPIDDKWRTIPGDIYFNTSDEYYFTGNGFGTANATTKFYVGFYLVYKDDQVGVITVINNRLNPNGPITVPAMTINLRIHVYNASI